VPEDFDDNLDEDLDLAFNPDAEEDDSESQQPFVANFKPATSAAEFQEKAQTLFSNALDFLNQKIVEGMAEASDIKTAVDIGKHFKIGIESVSELAKKAMEEAASYDEMAPDEPENLDAMRFED
jgi:hypothetical protein